MGRNNEWKRASDARRRRQQKQRLSNIGLVAIGLALGATIGGGIILCPQVADAIGPARFGSCHVGGGTNCVVDGDTFWMDGEKVRVADIDAPETHPSRCPIEEQLGSQATKRLRELLNSGPIELAAADRDTDRYGRKLHIVYLKGQSVGGILVSEGLARTWTGRREPWC
ncbi:thermonuclease family protein [Sphingobium sp. V4]|uniref:thermonuclease family protein n=1 Tax=Sphingobium sp. V4 TaxID=3038927 RepID=UPI002558267D|nr:thermonuclease family protein [Sphingobium sp. V4]WIW88940.1 thermonuclease family protein [Sphingobium sp. V4]